MNSIINDIDGQNYSTNDAGGGLISFERIQIWLWVTFKNQEMAFGYDDTHGKVVKNGLKHHFIMPTFCVGVNQSVNSTSLCSAVPISFK